VVRITPIYKPWSERPFRKGNTTTPLRGWNTNHGFFVCHLLHIQRLGFHPRNPVLCSTSWVSERGNLVQPSWDDPPRAPDSPSWSMQPTFRWTRAWRPCISYDVCSVCRRVCCNASDDGCGPDFYQKKGVGEEEQGGPLHYLFKKLGGSNLMQICGNFEGCLLKLLNCWGCLQKEGRGKKGKLGRETSRFSMCFFPCLFESGDSGDIPPWHQEAFRLFRVI